MSKFTRLFRRALGLTLFWVATLLPAQSPSLERLGAAEGLSQGMIFDLLQDQRGFLWFATKDGLNRYDGYTFQVFQNNPFDRFSLADNETQCLLQDQLNRIWIGTSNNGVQMFDLHSGRFYKLDKCIISNIKNLAQTTDGDLWACTNYGVNRLRIPEKIDPNNPNLESVAQVDTFFWDDPKTLTTAPLNQAVDLLGSRDGKLWVSTVRQIGYYEPKTGQFHKIWDNPTAAYQQFVSSHFKEAPDGSIWVGQPGQLLRIRGAKVEVFKLPEISPFPYTEMAFDAAGNLFIGTRKQIYRLANSQSASPERPDFELFYRFPSEGIIGTTRLLIDRNGLLWIGTNGYGLRKYNPGNPNFQHYLAGKSPRRILADRQGRAWAWYTEGNFKYLEGPGLPDESPLLKDPDLVQHDAVSTRDGKIWILSEIRKGQKNKGELLRLDGQSLVLEARFPIPDPATIGIYCSLYEDPSGVLWILGEKSVLIKFDPTSGQFLTFDFSKTLGFSSTALSIHMDPKGNLWLGTPHGLVQARPEGDQLHFILHKNNPDDQKTLNCNAVLATLDDPRQPEQYLWLGTKGGGLNRMNKQTGVFEHFTTKNGLPNNVVYAILADETNALWLSTNRGLSKFDPTSNIFQNFFSVDGLQDNEFNTLSYAKAPDGRMYFGGVNGITAFYPAALNASFAPPPVFITELKINNLAVQESDGILTTSVEETTSITLKHGQNQLTIEFAALDFAAPRMNQFRYRMRGISDNWMEATLNNSATFANLQPGNYAFELITGGSRGVWDESQIRRLEITILPPWWRTSWAYALYFVLLATGIWSFYRFQMNKIRLENKLEFEHQEAVRLVELDRLKTNFFSSITHEFRTPLTLLLEPARQLLAEAKDRTQRYRLELIEKNARRLLLFVNQLLDLSKLEAGQMPIDARPGYLESTLRAVFEQFKPLANQRAIRLELDLPEAQTPVYFDAVKWEQITSNLLSNALKFTEKGGLVALKLSVLPGEDPARMSFQLDVTDTGIGISAEDLPRVFDRFYQASATAQSRDREVVPGTGIGLSLTRELVERMGGSISVESPVEQGRGSRFRVVLPCETAHAQGIVSQEETPVLRSSDAYTMGQAEIPADLGQWTALPTEPSASPLLLLIEDDTELRQFLRASLPPGYRIAEAANGAEGIQMALELVPDLVISDLVMPQKDGFEVVEALKSNLSTSHIPFILLTAKSASETKMQGLSRGADAYLTKPFRADELVVHIENLLTSRRTLQQIFSQTIENQSLAESVVAALPAEENEFLQRLIQVIETNLDNEAMDAETFARSVFISRSQLHRKINALTGLSLTEFVRNYRLDRAKEMLSQRKGSISEIAWRTGFPNAKYFSTCFRERFGVTPSAALGQ